MSNQESLSSPPPADVPPRGALLRDLEDAAVRIGARATLSALAGASFGGLAGVFHGSPVFRHAAGTGLSCLLASVACLVPERAAALALARTEGGEAGRGPRGTYLTHAGGGLVGGAFLGGMYKGAPRSGAMLFVPLMTGAAFLEGAFESYREKELRRRGIRKGGRDP